MARTTFCHYGGVFFVPFVDHTYCNKQANNFDTLRYFGRCRNGKIIDGNGGWVDDKWVRQ